MNINGGTQVSGDPLIPPPDDQLLRLEKVAEIVGLSKSTIYSLISEGKFPISVKAATGAVRWRRSEINTWMARLPSTARQI